MSTIVVETRGGASRILPATPGLSLMEIIRDGGVDELLAICGGCCSCSTYHIYIDPAMAERLPVMGRDEDDLLDSSNFRTANSRLGCQVPFGQSLDGLTVIIAPEDWWSISARTAIVGSGI